MDTPSFPPPRDETEQDILAKLVLVRDELQLLKRDRRQYMQKQQILPLYHQTIEQIRRLQESRPPDQQVERNRVDKVLESCLHLLSLSFMTIGQTNTAAAAYALTSTIERLLDHLAEVDLFSAKDLESMSEALKKVSSNIKTAATAGEQSPYLIALVKNRLDYCQKSLEILQKRLEKYEEPVCDVHERLISILRSISLANVKAQFSESEVKKWRSQLVDVESKVKEGEYLKTDGTYPSGSEEVDQLLRKCLIWADIVLDRRGVIPEPFKHTYDRLVRIRNDLEKLSLTGKWSLREADLYDYKRELDTIDEKRIDGNWLDEDGNPAELYIQRTLLYLVRRSYGYIYALMNDSKPVSEALQPIYNQLQTLKDCLVAVKKNGGVSSVRELYPYSMKLNSLDNKRVDGKFMLGDDIPEGQGCLNELLADCFDISYELRVAAETAAEAEDDELDGDAMPVEEAGAEKGTDRTTRRLEGMSLDNRPDAEATPAGASKTGKQPSTE